VAEAYPGHGDPAFQHEGEIWVMMTVRCCDTQPMRTDAAPKIQLVAPRVWSPELNPSGALHGFGIDLRI